MANPLTLDELEKKSQEMLTLQHDLTNRLSQSQQIIADFSLELERLKEQITTKEGAERLLPGYLGTLQSALLEKQELIKNLIDDVTTLRSVIDKKDEHLRELKQKLTEKIAIATENEATAVTLKQELLEASKEIIRLKNDVAIFGSKFSEGDAQNKKLAADLLQTKDELQHTATELKAVQAALAEQQQNMKNTIKNLVDEHETVTKRIMNESVQRNLVLATEVRRLRNMVDAQRRTIELKEKKETELAQETVSRVKDLLAVKESASQTSEDLSGSVSPALSRLEYTQEAYVEEEEDLLESLRTLVGSDQYEQSATIPQLSDLCPMIETAFDHGDTKDEIIRSLRGCGYARSDIEAAFRKLGR
ncbi:hypothetical protein HY772_07295 [Candidatus Woesearchaeota archaeon]|nr:hypothetical protein [Candidatus Woesearchaeota archaeon]